MRASSVLVLVGFLGFTVSCAHKAKVDTGEPPQVKLEKVEKKVEKKQAAHTYTCLVGQDKRHVILDKKEKRCEVNYTKYGDIQQVAWAEATPSICDRAFNSIRSNIEGSGYKCVDGDDIQLENLKPKTAEKKAVETAANDTPAK